MIGDLDQGRTERREPQAAERRKSQFRKREKECILIHFPPPPPQGRSTIDVAVVAGQEAAVVPEANHHGDEKGMS